MDSQDLIRERLNNYIRDNGVTAKWVAEHSGGIPVDVMSRFRGNKKDLYEESLQALDTYLKSKNY